MPGMRSEEVGDQETEIGGDESGRNLPPPIAVAPTSREGGASLRAILCLSLGISSALMWCTPILPVGFFLAIVAMRLAWVEHRKPHEEGTDASKRFCDWGSFAALFGIIGPIMMVLPQLVMWWME